MPPPKESKKRRGDILSNNREKRHEKNNIDYDDIRNKLINTKGRVRSHEENALII